MQRRKPVNRFKRNRDHSPEPIIGEADLIVFDLLQGGPQSSPYLYQFTKHLWKNLIGQRDRLRQLFDHDYLDRPQGELNNMLVISDSLVYSLGTKGKEALRKAKLLHEFSAIPAANWHNFMDAAIDANLRLAIKKAGYRYISEEEILANAPDETKTAKHPLAIPTSISYTFWRKGKKITTHSNKATVPDRLFGIDYGSNECRFFARETDRATEQVDAPDLERNTILKKLLSYRNITITHEATTRFGIPNFFPIIYTNRVGRVATIIRHLENLYPDGCGNILVKAIPEFDTPSFRTVPLLPDIFDAPYQRARKADFFINQP